MRWKYSTIRAIEFVTFVCLIECKLVESIKSGYFSQLWDIISTRKHSQVIGRSSISLLKKKKINKFTNERNNSIKIGWMSLPKSAICIMGEGVPAKNVLCRLSYMAVYILQVLSTLIINIILLFSNPQLNIQAKKTKKKRKRDRRKCEINFLISTAIIISKFRKNNCQFFVNFN